MSQILEFVLNPFPSLQRQRLRRKTPSAQPTCRAADKDSHPWSWGQPRNGPEAEKRRSSVGGSGFFSTRLDFVGNTTIRKDGFHDCSILKSKGDERGLKTSRRAPAGAVKETRLPSRRVLEGATSERQGKSWKRECHSSNQRVFLEGKTSDIGVKTRPNRRERSVARVKLSLSARKRSCAKRALCKWQACDRSQKKKAERPCD